MKKITQYPLIFSVGFVLLMILIHKIPVFILFENLGYTTDEADMIDKIILNSFVIILSIIVIKKEKLNSYAGLHFRIMQEPQLYLILFVYVLIFTNGFHSFRTIFASENMNMLNFMVVLLVIKSLTIGLIEEIVFRSLIQSIIVREFTSKNKKIVISITAAALIFGIAHIINITNDGYSLKGVMNQIFAATCLGSLFGVILLRTKNIYPIIFFHSIIAFFSSIGSLYPIYFVNEQANTAKTISQTILSFFLMLVIFGFPYLIALYLMKKLQDKQNILVEIESK